MILFKRYNFIDIFIIALQQTGKGRERYEMAWPAGVGVGRGWGAGVQRSSCQATNPPEAPHVAGAARSSIPIGFRYDGGENFPSTHLNFCRRHEWKRGEGVGRGRGGRGGGWRIRGGGVTCWTVLILDGNLGRCRLGEPAGELWNFRSRPRRWQTAATVTKAEQTEQRSRRPERRISTWSFPISDTAFFASGNNPDSGTSKILINITGYLRIIVSNYL